MHPHFSDWVPQVECKAKSVIIGRKRGDDPDSYTCFINLFDVNDPHLKDTVPLQFHDFEKITKVKIKDLVVNYFLDGNDLVINDLETLSIEQKGAKLYISGKQKW